MVRFAIYVAGAALFASTAAAARDLPSEFAENVMNACRPDAQRVCSQVQPGEGRVARCLLSHERELAPPCLKGIKIAYAIEVCMSEYRQLCAAVPQGPRAVECLARRVEALRPECQRVVSASAPFIEGPRERYGYNRGPAPYGEPYPPRYYSSPYQEPPRDQDAYLGDEDRNPDRPPYFDRSPSPYDGRYAERDYDRSRRQPYGEQPYGEQPYGQPPYGDEPYSDGRNSGPGYYNDESSPYPPQGDRGPR